MLVEVFVKKVVCLVGLGAHQEKVMAVCEDLRC